MTTTLPRPAEGRIVAGQTLANQVADLMARVHPETGDCVGGWLVAEDHRDGTAVVVWQQGDGTWPATLRGTVMWRWLWALRGAGFTVEPRLDMEVFGRPDEESPDGRARWLHVTARTPITAAPARPVTCLYCRTEITGRTIRGCCSGRCAYLEHDADDYEPQED